MDQFSAHSSPLTLSFPHFPFCLAVTRQGKLEVASVRSQHKAELREAEKVSKVLQAEKEALTRELHKLQDEHDACHQDLAKCKTELTHAKDEVGPSLPLHIFPGRS